METSKIYIMLEQIVTGTKVLGFDEIEKASDPEEAELMVAIRFLQEELDYQKSETQRYLDQLTDIVESFPYGLIVCQLEDFSDSNSFRIIRVNDAAKRDSNTGLAEKVGKIIIDALPLIKSTKILDSYRDLVLKQESRDFGIVEVGPNEMFDYKGYWRVKCFPVLSDQLCVVLHEITEEKRKEAQAKKDLAFAAHAGRLRLMGEMAGSIGHEINQPLAIIQNLVELLRISANPKTEINEEKLLSIADRVETQVERASKIVKSLKDLSRLHTEKESCSLEESLQEALNFFKVDFQIEGIGVHIASNPTPSLWLDKSQIVQIFINLLANAHYGLRERAEHNPDFEPSLKISLSLEGNTVVFSCQDNGCGMSPETLAKCQEPFFTTKPVGIGTGLGLSVISRIISEFGGTLEITSVEGEGTTISIVFPNT